jgi:SAM-dependent methyltransferase
MLAAVSRSLFATLFPSLERRLAALEELTLDLQTAPDGLPIPPPYLRALVAGIHEGIGGYIQNGKAAAEGLVRIVEECGFDMQTFEAILDFGCGCGRTMRHFKSQSGLYAGSTAYLRKVQLHGTDYNPELIAWCRQHLPFAEFGVNDARPPLRYRDGQFDLVYALSVFTHLPEPEQFTWLAELTRVLKPGGLILLQTSGRLYAENVSHEWPQLPQSVKDQFQAGELVVLRPEAYDDYRTNGVCDVFHPPGYVRDKLAQGLELITSTETDAGDLYLLLKPVL